MAQQTGKTAPRFEAASLKVTPPHAPTPGGMTMGMGCAGGPGTYDPTRVTCENMPLVFYVREAYGIKRYQLSAPAWMSADRFDLQATVAPGATREQLRLMEQALLAERFGLVVHRESRAATVATLKLAPGQLKLHASQPSGTAPPATQKPVPNVTLEIAPDGCPVVPKNLQQEMGTFFEIRGDDGRICLHAVHESMDDFAARLEQRLNAPVHNETGLTGAYDISLGFLPDGGTANPGAGPPLPSLATALREQLGIDLVMGRGPIDTIVVDQCNENPTRNGSTDIRASSLPHSPAAISSGASASSILNRAPGV